MGYRIRVVPEVEAWLVELRGHRSRCRTRYERDRGSTG
jgi:hypothetical protein